MAWSALTFDSGDLNKKLNYAAAYTTSDGKSTGSADVLGLKVKGVFENVSIGVQSSLGNGDFSAYTTATLAASDKLATHSEKDPLVFTLAARNLKEAINLSNVSINVFLTAMENIAALRAVNGAAMSRLEFQQVNLSRQRTNMEAANGRIVDVDMGAETTRMAKYSVLRQASAAMLAQANTAPEVALMLLR